MTLTSEGSGPTFDLRQLFELFGILVIVNYQRLIIKLNILGRHRIKILVYLIPDFVISIKFEIHLWTIIRQGVIGCLHYLV